MNNLIRDISLVLLDFDIPHLIFVASGVPAVVDFAAMRDAVKRLGGDPEKINPVCPSDLVIDHSVQVDVTRRLANDNLCFSIV